MRTFLVLFCLCLLCSCGEGAEFKATPVLLTKVESEYWDKAKAWGLSEVDFQRLRIAWTVTRRGTDETLAQVVGERYADLGKRVLSLIRKSGMSLSPDKAVEVDMLYRECCAELLLNLKDVEEEKKIVNLWLKVMKV